MSVVRATQPNRLRPTLPRPPVWDWPYLGGENHWSLGFVHRESDAEYMDQTILPQAASTAVAGSCFSKRNGFIRLFCEAERSGDSRLLKSPDVYRDPAHCGLLLSLRTASRRNRDSMDRESAALASSCNGKPSRTFSTGKGIYQFHSFDPVITLVPSSSTSKLST